MTVKTAISLRSPLLAKIDAAAAQLGISRNRFTALAAEELVTKLDNQRLLARLNEAYADGPTEEEREDDPRPLDGPGFFEDFFDA